MAKVINFELDEQTEKRLNEIAVKNGIVTKSGTIRFLINQEWFRQNNLQTENSTRIGSTEALK
jgi:metal-responsive CopG/Arc/MetJ family transcriptional regulator